MSIVLFVEWSIDKSFRLKRQFAQTEEIGSNPFTHANAFTMGLMLQFPRYNGVRMLHPERVSCESSNLSGNTKYLSMTVSAKDLENLYYDNMKSDHELYGWYIDCNESKGEFDAEKGVKFDFPVFLYNTKGDLVGKAKGGVCGQDGVEFYSELTFK